MFRIHVSKTLTLLSVSKFELIGSDNVELFLNVIRCFLRILHVLDWVCVLLVTTLGGTRVTRGDGAALGLLLQSLER